MSFFGPGGALLQKPALALSQLVIDTDKDWQKYAVVGVPGFACRKSFTVRGSGALQAIYQLKLTVYRGAGVDSGNNVYLNNRALSWPNDIRFTTSDKVTLLDYWIETFDASQATVWVEFNSLAPLPSKTTFYFYYGNAGAVSLSSVANTFTRVIDQLVAAWGFDEGTGAIAGDRSGNGHDATLLPVGGEPLWVDGLYGGRALTFDGINQRAQAPASPGLRLDPFSIEAHYNPSSLPAATRTLFGNTIGNNGIGLNINQDGNGTPHAGYVGVWFYGGGGWRGVGSTTSILTAGTDKHLVATYDHVNLKLYLNGILNNQSPHSQAVTYPAAVPGDIFFSSGAPGQNLAGTGDEIRLYSKALSQDEVTDLAGNPGYTTLNYPGFVLVHKYASPQPGIDTWGSEESASVPVAVPCGLTNLTQLAAAMQKGDLVYFDGVRLVRLPSGSIGKCLTTHDFGNDPAWEYPP